MAQIVNAKYVSVWDGNQLVETDCKFDTTNNAVFDVEQADVEELDLNYLVEQYVELEDGSQILTFFNKDDNSEVINGESQTPDEYAS